MSAKIKQMKDKSGTKVYPITRSNAVYMSNGITTIDAALDDMREGNTTIVFNNNGTISTTLASGNVVTTSFLQNGNIQEKCVDSDNNEIYTKTTTFNVDGSISTEFDWGDE